MPTETVTYAIPSGETERYTESIISTAKDPAQAIAAAAADGWHSFRTVEYTLGERPNFARTLA